MLCSMSMSLVCIWITEEHSCQNTELLLASALIHTHMANRGNKNNFESSLEGCQ